MPSFVVPQNQDDAIAEHVAQLIEDFQGIRNIPLSVTGINDAAAYALTLKNAGTGSKGLIIYAADGTTVLLQVDSAGVKASPDGVAAAAAPVTLAGTQTLTNKTLTTPVFSGQPTGTGFGAWTAFTPALNQGGAVATTVNLARYQIIGKTAFVQMLLTATAAGGAGNITITGLPAAIAPFSTSNALPVGTFYYSGAANRSGVAIATTTTSLAFFVDNNAGYLGGAPAATLANGHVIGVNAMWELA